MSIGNQNFVPGMGQVPYNENLYELNEHNMYLFDQQTPQLNRFEDKPTEMLHNLGYSSSNPCPDANVAEAHLEGQYNEPSMWNDDTTFSHGNTLPIQSMSSVSSPLTGVPLAHVSTLDQKSTQEAGKVGKARRARDKPILTEEESRLIDCPDVQLSEKELAVKKKALNRMAQRAFRERKETKLKQLESKLLESEDERQKLRDELEQIQVRYASLSSENRILRTGNESSDSPTEIKDQKFSFPSTQDQFILNMLEGNTVHKVNPENVNRVYNEPTNPSAKLLAIGAVWDYLQIKQEEEEFENVDMLEVMQHLRGNEKCHGYGPAYALDLVNNVLHSVASRQYGNVL